MGLSDSERYCYVFYSLRTLDGILHRIKQDKSVSSYDASILEPIVRLADDAWPAFLNQQTNSTYWLLGSATHNTVTHGTTPWDVAIMGHLDGMFPGKEKNEWPEKTDFDATEFCSMRYLLAHDGNIVEAYVFEIYQVMESLIYSVRRYKDEFLEKCRDLDRIISKVQGLSFGFFSSRECYAKAYLIKEMMPILYGREYPYRPEEYDFVTDHMAKHHVHHQIANLMKKPLSFLVNLHVDLVKAKFVGDKLFETRILSLVEIDTQLYEFMHIKRDFLSNPKFSNLDESIRKLVTSKMDEKQKEYDKETKEKKEKVEKYPDNLGVYGSEGDWTMHELAQKKDKEKASQTGNKTIEHAKIAKDIAKKSSDKPSKNTGNKTIEHAKIAKDIYNKAKKK